MMKKMQEKKVEWKSAGHGEYSEIPEEKEFFTVTKGSDNCVIHFYRDETFRCKIFDKHFSLLAKKHLETRFCKINAEKCPFLCDRLKIKVIPTVLCIKNQQTTGQIVGFADLGNTDEFSTEMLEWRLAHVSDVSLNLHFKHKILSLLRVVYKTGFSIYGELFLQAEVINYSGDLQTPPDQAERKKKTNFVGKKVKGRGKRNDDDSSDENDW